MNTGHVAVIDIGKTNAKLALVDLADLSELQVITRPNAVLCSPPWPHFDTEGHWRFLLDGLLSFHASHGVDAISITTHGACCAILDASGALAAPILDYEYTGPDTVAEAYNSIRPPFSESGSPRLGMGLNIGAQLFWQLRVDPGLKDRAHRIVTYPQYWGHRLTGIAATDVTSLGCHTDLWNPHESRFSSLVETLGIADKIAPARRSNEVLGTLLPEISAATGLRLETPVHVGIHDSNASLLPHLLANEPPFSVVSTGTWVIAMTNGGKAVELDPEKDALINVNAHGEPVPSARFMGGREHDLATVETYPVPTDADLHNVLSEQLMLLPAVENTSGPFKGRKARWHGTTPRPGTARIGAAVALYLALVTRECLRNIGHEGLIVVEGPFAGNRVFLRMLATLTGSQVATSNGVTGTSQGAALLVRQEPLKSAPKVTVSPEQGEMQSLILRYAESWQTEIGTR